MPEYHILLLPKDNYYGWVEAAKDYARLFGVNLTSDPDTAGRYMAPNQVITVAGPPQGYPGQGDIRTWFRDHYPGIRLDYLPFNTPADLRAALHERIAANDRFRVVGTSFKLRWPTDFAKVTQGFGEHPEYFRRRSLPGHDGLDIFAPRGAQVYACADGTVLRVESFNGNPAQMPYGNSVHLQHRDGYQTIYAHLQQILVTHGAAVQAGQVIGLAGSTGDSSGHYVHLTLTRTGATEAGLTQYPNDILDPTPYLEWPSADTVPSGITYPWPTGFCLAGVHGRADGPLQDADFPPLAQARMEAVKLLTTARPEDVDRLRAQNPRVFILVRLFASFDGRVVRPDEFVSWLGPEMEPYYQRGIRYFEVHNEPNLRPEGWTTSWNDGAEFGNWFIDVRNRLKQLYPAGLFGYPGLSPGEAIDGLRMRALDFLTGSDAACRAADWIGLHCYWVSEQEFNSAAGGLGYLEYRRRFPDKVLFITEFSNPSPDTDFGTKGQQYVRYYQHLRSIPGMGAAFSFVLSASTGFANEVWRREDGSLTAIPGVVGARTDTATTPPPPPPPA